MASVYRIKRKEKVTKVAAPVKNPELLTDLNLTTASAPTEARADKVAPLAEVTRRAVPETEAAPTFRDEMFTAPAKEPASPIEEEIALGNEAVGESESAPAETENEVIGDADVRMPEPEKDKKERDYDEELIRQLTREAENDNAAELPGVKPGEIDFAKLDAVFGHARAAAAEVAAEKGTDETASLLMQVFGETDGKKRKKKKKEKEKEEGVETSSQSEEIRAVFSDEKTQAETPAEGIPETDLPAGATQAFSAVKPTDDGEYVAVHINEDEKTREYNAKEEAAEEAAEEVSDGPQVADELNVPDQGTPYSDTYDELENTGKSRLSILPEEYSSREQYDEFAEHLRNKNFRSLINCVWLFLLFGVVLYLESATFSNLYHPDFLKPYGTFNVIYLLVDVQLIFISALFQLSALGDGIKKLFTGKANRDSLTFLVMLFAAANSILLIVFPAEKYVLFGSIALLYALLNGFARFLDNKRLYRSFRVAASRHTKFVGEEVAGDSAENEAFRELLPGEQKIYTVQRAELITDFFKRSKKTPRSQKVYGWTIVLSLLISIGFAVYYYLQNGTVSGTVSAFMVTAFMTLPLCGIFTQSLPQAHFTRKAEKKDAAIISLAEAEDCSRASVVSFTDKEVFPAKYVKVTTIRTYGQTRIDKAILYAAMIFEKLGGPLSQVFKKTISGVVEEISEDFDFSEITADGMCAKLDGQDVFVGNKDYMLSYDFGYPKDTMDEGFEENSGKIMYMVIGTELAAKFYIKYSVSTRFKKTLVSLYKAGICPAVKTCDPNIDTNLLQNLLKSDKIPAGVIKTTDAMKDAPTLETSQSGVVCTSSIAGLLQTFVLSDAMVHTVRVNGVIKILSLLAGAGAVAFMYLTGNFAKADAVFVMLYQLLWMVPVFLPNIFA